jgi:hypothetical protein
VLKVVIVKEMVKRGKENPRHRAQNPRCVRLFETVLLLVFGHWVLNLVP